MLPLWIGQACTDITGRIAEHVRILAQHKSKFAEDSVEAQILSRCIQKLEKWGTDIYTSLFSEFLPVAKQEVSMPSDQSQETLENLIKTLSHNLSSLPLTIHQDGARVIQSMDNEETLREMIGLLSNPQSLATLTEGIRRSFTQ